ncbi:MAG: PTS sugar transporter subunit IIA [Pseudomonadota bacterium]
MQLTHYISPKDIIIPLKGDTKEKIYKELVEQLANSNGLSDKSKLFQSIMERESSSTTFLPMGVAIPHARIPQIKDIKLIIGIANKPVRDEGPAALPLTASVFCLFFSPTEEQSFGKHLKLLSRISAIFSDTEVVTALSKLTSADLAFEVIQHREREMSEA